MFDSLHHMGRAGLHEDVSWSSEPPDDGDVKSLGRWSSEMQAAVEHLEALASSLAVMVRDGAVDPVLAEASCDAMAVASRLAGCADVVGSLALAEMEVTSGHLADGVRDSRSWAVLHGGVPMARVRSWERAVRCFARFPRVAAAFLDGRLRAYHLDAIDSIIPPRFCGAALEQAVEMVASVQDDLLAAAEACDGERRFRRFCANVRARLDVDGPAPDADCGSFFELRPRGNGRWHLMADLSDTEAAIVGTVIEERDRRNVLSHSDDDGPILPTGVRRAAALVELIRGGAASSRPGRIGLYVHLDLDDLAARGASAAPMAHTEANYDISVDSLWALLADADVVPVITHDGRPLSYGRTQRLTPDILRRVLAHRDTTCAFPGCTAPPIWQQQHHTDHWDDGGTTDPDVCRGTCGFHHGLHHTDGWGLDPPPEGAPGPYRVTRPNGTPFDPTPRWRRERPDPIVQYAKLRAGTLAAAA